MRQAASPFLNKKFRHAVAVMVDIAWYGRSGLVSSLDLALRQDVPRRYLEPILQNLVKARLLTGARGPQGGYRLGRERRLLSLADIWAVIAPLEEADEKQTNSANPQDTSQNSLVSLHSAVLAPLWQDIDQDISQRLANITLEWICAEAEASHIDTEPPARHDFSI